MKIFYFANMRLPTEKAHGVQIMKMCEGLARAGGEVELIVPTRINPQSGDPFAFYRVERNFKLRKLWCVDFLALPFLKALGFWLQGIGFLKVAALFSIFRKFDVCYTRDVILAAFLPRRGAKLVYEVHSMPESGLSLHKRAWARAGLIVVISEGLLRALMAQGVAADKILLARDAVDLAQFQIQKSKEECRVVLHLPQDKKLVVYTGHLYKWKGADALAMAAAYLPTSVAVYLVGGTSEDIKSFKQKYQFPNLHIVGWQEQAMIPLWLHAADILVLPNSAAEKIGAEYTSPLKLFEYMASGTPIAASDVPALREVLTEKEAIFFKPDDERSLADAITRGLHNEVFANGLAVAALDKVREYTWDKRAKVILGRIS